MNVEQREMASTGLTIFVQHLGEHYRQVGQDLNTSLQGVESSPQEAIENKRLLDGVAALLPHQNNGVIQVGSVAEVRWLQSSLVRLGGRPTYIFGQALRDDGVSLLLHGPSDTQGPRPLQEETGKIEVAHLRGRGFLKQHADKQALSNTVLSEAELNTFYRKNSYHISWRTPGFLAINTDPFQNRIRAMAGALIVTQDLEPALEALSDATLAKYNVFDHINHLVTAFNVVAEAQAVIAGTGLSKRVSGTETGNSVLQTGNEIRSGTLISNLAKALLRRIQEHTES